MGAALGKGGQALQHILDPIEKMARFRRVVMLRNVLKDLLEITYRIPSQQYLEALQPALLFLARKRPITSAAGTTLPSSICRLPRARILSSASVS